MTAQIIPVAVFDLVVFGATGDLAMRKLMPGLYHRDSDGQLPAEARVIGAARSELTAPDIWRSRGGAGAVRRRGSQSGGAAALPGPGGLCPVDAMGGSGWDDLALR